MVLFTMKFVVHVSSSEDGEYVAECPQMGLTAKGLAPSSALDSLRENIRYNLEYCPCSSVDPGSIEFEIS